MALKYTGGYGKSVGYSYKPPAAKKALGPKTPITINPAALPAWNAKLASVGLSPAGTPGGPAPLPPPLPFYGDLDTQDATSLAQYNNTQSALTYQQGQLNQEYGMGGDTSDPFNKANLLERSFKQRQAYDTNSLASRGQQYSGAKLNADAASQYSHDQSYDALSRAYQQGTQGIKQQGLSAYTSYQGTVNADQQARLARALGITN